MSRNSRATCCGWATIGKALRVRTAGDERVFVRVVGPPYYTVLQALEQTDPGSLRAFVEQAAGVWIEVGWSHPLADRIAPAGNGVLLIGPPASGTTSRPRPSPICTASPRFTLPASAAAAVEPRPFDRLWKCR